MNAKVSAVYTYNKHAIPSCLTEIFPDAIVVVHTCQWKTSHFEVNDMVEFFGVHFSAHAAVRIPITSWWRQFLF